MTKLAGQMYWKPPGVGMVGVASWGVLPPGSEAAGDWLCCYCQSPDCVEWPDFWALPGTTRPEAELAYQEGRWLGAAHHVGDCQLLDEPPEGWRSEAT